MQPDVPSLAIDHLDHLVLTVEDTARACAFYEKLGMTRITFGDGRVAVAFGSRLQQRIHFHEVGRVIHPRAGRATVGSADFCLITSLDVESLQHRLGALGISPELGPVPRNGAAGPILSFYIRDPDNNLVEIAVSVVANDPTGI
ncbi:MAG TPA: VOC family protein [Phycisphaerae bacterium]|nr:VOC family protein [Phycisphaerae bacterium]